jgi:hypothetical protein
MSTAPWTLDHNRQAIHRGAHKSAKEYTEFLREEFVDMIKKGYWTILPASSIMHLAHLRLSPLGVVPQCE